MNEETLTQIAARCGTTPDVVRKTCEAIIESQTLPTMQDANYLLGKHVIAVVSHGFVATGILQSVNKEFVRIVGASIITRWGTTRGLGQLALDGRTPTSDIHPCGELLIPSGQLIFFLPSVELTPNPA